MSNNPIIQLISNSNEPINNSLSNYKTKQLNIKNNCKNFMDSQKKNA